MRKSLPCNAKEEVLNNGQAVTRRDPHQKVNNQDVAFKRRGFRNTDPNQL